MLPYLRLEGPPYDQGLAQGKALSDRIAHNVELYFQRFEVECHLSPREARARGARYLEALRQQSPAYVQGLEGLALGSGQPLLDIATLNVRYEIVYHQFGQEAVYPGREAPNGCTAFALMPGESADGNLWLGQNWDWMEGVQGALQHITEPDGTQVLAFTEAGIFGGKMGLNNHGLGLCINGLVSLGDDWAKLGPPFHLRTYQALRQKTLAEAEAAILTPPRTQSGNFLLGQGDKAVDLEVSPQGVARWEDPRWLVHANHYIAPERFGIEVPPIEWLDRSQHRAERLQKRLSQVKKPSLQDLQAALSDREGAPYAVCRTASAEEYALGEPYRTIVSVIMNLGTREMWVSDGPPHENPYTRYSL